MREWCSAEFLLGATNSFIYISPIPQPARLELVGRCKFYKNISSKYKIPPFIYFHNIRRQ